MLDNLPQPLAVMKCTNEYGGETTFYILGTAHVSTASCQDVVTLIRAVQPEVVMVELCVERKPILSMEKVKVGTGASAAQGTAAILATLLKNSCTAGTCE